MSGTTTKMNCEQDQIEIVRSNWELGFESRLTKMKKKKNKRESLKANESAKEGREVIVKRAKESSKFTASVCFESVNQDSTKRSTTMSQAKEHAYAEPAQAEES